MRTKVWQVFDVVAANGSDIEILVGIGRYGIHLRSLKFPSFVFKCEFFLHRFITGDAVV